MRGFLALVAGAAAIPSLAASPAIPALEPVAASWLAIPASMLATPDPAFAWPCALGFLGIVVLRRMRSGPMN